MKQLIKTETMCAVTKKVVDNFNKMDNKEFMGMYQCSKKVFAKRVARYGDPYMNAPLAKLGKFLSKHIFK